MNFLAFICILLGALLVRPERLHGFHSIKWENSIGEIYYFNNYEQSLYKFNHQIETKIVIISDAVSISEHPLNEIQDITGDNDGNLYSSRCQQNQIQKLSPSLPFTGNLQENMNYYNVELFAGAADGKLGQTEDGEHAKGNPITCPWGLAFSTFNNRKQLYFVEHGSCRIRMISIGDPKDEKNGVFHTIAGDSCSGRLAVPSLPFEPLRNIYYLYIDPLTADIYFPELSSKKVFKISSSSTPPKQQQLTLVSDYSATTVEEEEGDTTIPLHIFPGSPGELLLVSDSGNTVQKIPTSSDLHEMQPAQHLSNRNLGHHLQLEAIPSGAGITILGGAAGDQLGYSVCVGGDINGDSKADILLGAPGYSSSTGRAYAIYGSNALSNIDLSSFASGGITITGAGSANGLGTTVDIGGDANGDSKADMFIAAPTVTTNTGVAYLVYGGASLTNVATGTLGTAGVAFTGAAVNTFASTGISLNYDNNQDGKVDPVIGAYGHNSNQGRTYLVLGSATLTSIGISTLGGDAYGSGPAGTGKSGYSLDSGGDINGDSKTDLMIGTPETAVGGTVFIIFGGANWGNIPGLGGIVSPEGFTITGPGAGCLAGDSVSIGGDVNGDGKSDMLIGAPGCSSAAGTVYLVYGSAAPASFTLSGTMTQGVSFTGATAGDQVGSSVAVGGDFNGDGKADILIGAPGYSSNTGIVYLIYGSATLANLALGSFSGSNGIKITGEYGGCFTGFSVSLRGDVNGDSKADILIGAYGYAASKGKVYLIYGTASPTNILLASDTPTYTPTKSPTFQPTFTPSAAPTRTPSAIPTFAPTRTPTFLPTSQPSARPTRQPTCNCYFFSLLYSS
jgi:hypothetical protein